MTKSSIYKFPLFEIGILVLLNVKRSIFLTKLFKMYSLKKQFETGLPKNK